MTSFKYLNKSKLCNTTLFLVMFLSASFYAEETLTLPELKKRVKTNGEMFEVNVDSAFRQIDFLIYNATLLKDSISMLKLLERKCRYYYSKSDVEKLFDMAMEYQETSIKYQCIKDRAAAHIFIAEAYSFTELYNKSLIELRYAQQLMDTLATPSPDETNVKMNILTSFANVYLQQNKSQEAIHSLFTANELAAKMKDTERGKTFQHINYSNLASIFMLFNMDSAKYYAQLSSEIVPPKLQDSKIIAQNNYVMGRYYELNNNDNKAFSYYIDAYDLLKSNGEKLNSRPLYLALINVSRKRGDTQSVKKFEALLHDVEMSSLESKYKTINKILEDQTGILTLENKKRKSGIVFGLLVGLAFSIALSAYLYFSKKKKKNVIGPENYEMLIKMLESNEPGFMGAFEKMYPNFTKKLLSINAKLSRTEIEFCALLKLNLTTKQISSLRFIEIRTVQNKKYRIRKRLNIPESSDIYNWFELI